MAEKNILQEMTAIMREADLAFETVGGSTRHYLRDVLFPLMEKNGLKIVSDERQPGAVWVKASERLPVEDGYYCFKANGGYMGAYLRTASNGSRWFCDSAGGTIRSWKQCEWLDESAEQPGREVEAETFAKYLDEQRNNHTADMWAEKAIWDKLTAFQEWLKYFKEQKGVITHEK